MGNPFWMGMMMGHAWNLLILGLGIGMGKHPYDEVTKRPELALTVPGESFITTTTIEDDQMLAEALGITISVACVPKTRGKGEIPDFERRQELSPITCGSGYKCDKNSCGSGAVSVPAYISKLLPGNTVGSQCESLNFPCFPIFESYCKKYATNYGSKCSGVYDQINFIGRTICLDFCCLCPSVFRSCKCNCCKCLKNRGGTCGNTECNIGCPGSELINKQTNKDILAKKKNPPKKKKKKKKKKS